jgi:hypothetical protein
MKKQSKKLMLAKETVRALNSAEGAAVGRFPEVGTFGDSEFYRCWGSLTCPSFTC